MEQKPFFLDLLSKEATERFMSEASLASSELTCALAHFWEQMTSPPAIPPLNLLLHFERNALRLFDLSASELLYMVREQLVTKGELRNLLFESVGPQVVNLLFGWRPNGVSLPRLDSATINSSLKESWTLAERAFFLSDEDRTLRERWFTELLNYFNSGGRTRFRTALMARLWIRLDEHWLPIIAIEARTSQKGGKPSDEPPRVEQAAVEDVVASGSSKSDPATEANTGAGTNRHGAKIILDSAPLPLGDQKEIDQTLEQWRDGIRTDINLLWGWSGSLAESTPPESMEYFRELNPELRKRSFLGLAFDWEGSGREILSHDQIAATLLKNLQKALKRYVQQAIHLVSSKWADKRIYPSTFVSRMESAGEALEADVFDILRTGVGKLARGTSTHRLEQALSKEVKAGIAREVTLYRRNAQLTGLCELLERDDVVAEHRATDRSLSAPLEGVSTPHPAAREQSDATRADSRGSHEPVRAEPAAVDMEPDEADATTGKALFGQPDRKTDGPIVMHTISDLLRDIDEVSIPFPRDALIDGLEATRGRHIGELRGKIPAWEMPPLGRLSKDSWILLDKTLVALAGELLSGILEGLTLHNAGIYEEVAASLARRVRAFIGRA